MNKTNGELEEWRNKLKENKERKMIIEQDIRRNIDKLMIYEVEKEKVDIEMREKAEECKNLKNRIKEAEEKVSRLELRSNNSEHTIRMVFNEKDEDDNDYDYGYSEDVKFYINNEFIGDGTYGSEPEDNTRYRDYRWVEEIIEKICRKLKIDLIIEENGER